MEQEEKKVILPWDEYQELLDDRKALKEAREELKKDCKERGLYMETKIIFDKDGFLNNPLECVSPRTNIISKDEALKAAQKEVDRIAHSAKTIIEAQDKRINRLINRNLWNRIINNWMM